MPRSGHRQRAAISAAVAGVLPMAVNKPRSTAALSAPVFLKGVDRFKETLRRRRGGIRHKNQAFFTKHAFKPTATPSILQEIS
jgi:hypothetical protein